MSQALSSPQQVVFVADAVDVLDVADVDLAAFADARGRRWECCPGTREEEDEDDDAGAVVSARPQRVVFVPAAGDRLDPAERASDSCITWPSQPSSVDNEDEAGTCPQTHQSDKKTTTRRIGAHAVPHGM